MKDFWVEASRAKATVLNILRPEFDEASAKKYMEHLISSLKAVGKAKAKALWERGLAICKGFGEAMCEQAQADNVQEIDKKLKDDDLVSTDGAALFKLTRDGAAKQLNVSWRQYYQSMQSLEALSKHLADSKAPDIELRTELDFAIETESDAIANAKAMVANIIAVQVAFKPLKAGNDRSASLAAGKANVDLLGIKMSDHVAKLFTNTT